MTLQNALFIGVDVQPETGQARQSLTWAVLDDRLRLVNLAHTSLEELTAHLNGLDTARVGVNAPRSLAKGLMKQHEVRLGLNPQPKGGRWANFRVCEYLLRTRGLPVTGAGESGDKAWVKLGLQVYAALDGLGFTAYPSEDKPRQSLEVYAQGAYAVLLGLAPFQRGTLEGRLQRQLILSEQRVRVTDPMNFFEEITRHRLRQGILPLKGIYTNGELDALMAAYMAYMAALHPSKMELVGLVEDGQVVMPLPVAAS
ncbi:MAG TPA: DUF429 domain-containing protein [Anaerolineaceae bacterium]|nr:DUF429 domain-containing protein [Anaerolineaceae bacterium]HPN51647.1 DUF429 domain-containing protein [Anaerolineaceae bacterium]